MLLLPEEKIGEPLETSKNQCSFGNLEALDRKVGHAVAQLVEALHNKPEGRGFDSRWCRWIFSLTYPSGRTMALGLTQSLTEMSTRNVSWGVKAAGA